jgi:hypothetical protein
MITNLLKNFITNVYLLELFNTLFVILYITRSNFDESTC